MKNTSVNLTSYGAFIVMRAALKTAINVVMKCAENASTETARKFAEMNSELHEMQEQLHSGVYRYTETTGDGLQIALLAYDVYCNEIARADFDESEKPFDVWRNEKTPHKHIDKRVKIQDIASAALKTEMLAPSQIAYRECRRYIEQHTAPDTRRQKCFYFADIATMKDDESGLTYKALVYTEKKYDDIERNDLQAIENLIDFMQLTATQANVLTLRLKGYGLQAIGTYYGKSKQAVAKTLAQIKAKFIACFEMSACNVFAAFIESLDTEPDTEPDTETAPDTEPNTETAPETMTAYERYESNRLQREHKAANIANMLAMKNRTAREKVAANIANGLVFPE